MRTLSWFVMFAVVLGIVGCLSVEKQQRMDALMAENAKLAGEMKKLQEESESVYKKFKAGTATAEEIAALTVKIPAAIGAVHELITKNVSEIKEIKDGASWTAVLGGVVGGLARSGVHLIQAAVPASGPLGLGINALLTLLLGGSSTVKKPEAVVPPKV